MAASPFDPPTGGPGGAVSSYRRDAPGAIAGHGGRLKPRCGPLLARAVEHLGIDPNLRDALADRASANGSFLADEILAGGHAAAQTIAEACAAVLGLPMEPIAPDAAILRDGRGGLRTGSRHVWTCGADNRNRLFFAPTLETLDELASQLAECRDGASLCVTTLDDIRRLQAATSQEERSTRARLSLAEDRNAFSARDTLRPFQASLLTLLLVAVAAAFLRRPEGAWLATHVAFSLLALAFNGLRAAVLLVPHGLRDRATVPRALGTHRPLPVYSVLVALHREAAMAPSVVAAMAALDWPRSRLEVFFVCEANDPGTIAAVEEAIRGEPNFTVVATPRSRPQTKPKALNFALPLTRGEFVVLYDAEDRPDPGQLREAHARFAASPPELACLQAPLSVRNFEESWLSAHFAMEYAALFRKVLPWLASHGLPVPLGGTSNHFRRRILVEVGGWDSHNVAEDADLGMRLARAGYDVGTIGRPTSESATTRRRDWIHQRTRWMKGWCQTWLVHMRDPARLAKDLGAVRFAIFQLLFAGMIGTAIMHLFFAVTLAWGLAHLLAGEAVTFEMGLLMTLDGFNIVSAWTIHAALVGTALRGGEKPLLRRLPSLWGYWMLTTAAVFRAIRQLAADPHLWEKTPHHEDTRPMPAMRDRRVAP